MNPPAAAEGADGGAELRAPFNGKVIAVHVQPGAAVCKGDPLVTLESMKLEHVLSAKGDGIVDTVDRRTGQFVVNLVDMDSKLNTTTDLSPIEEDSVGLHPNLVRGAIVDAQCSGASANINAERPPREGLLENALAEIASEKEGLRTAFA